MQVYVVRHGIALDVDGAAVRSDAARPLSPEGREKTDEVGRGLAALGVKVDVIGTSPLVRARETAEVLAKHVGGKNVRVEECAFLAPCGTPEHAAAWLRGLAVESVMVVGHMPDVSVLLSRVLARSGGMGFNFKKAAVACVSYASGSGSLEWFLQPRHLRALADPGQ